MAVELDRHVLTQARGWLVRVRRRAWTAHALDMVLLLVALLLFHNVAFDHPLGGWAGMWLAAVVVVVVARQAAYRAYGRAQDHVCRAMYGPGWRDADTGQRPLHHADLAVAAGLAGQLESRVRRRMWWQRATVRLRSAAMVPLIGTVGLTISGILVTGDLSWAWLAFLWWGVLTAAHLTCQQVAWLILDDTTLIRIDAYLAVLADVEGTA